MADTDPELAAQLLAAFSVPAPQEEKHDPDPLIQQAQIQPAEPQVQAPGPQVHTPETQAQQPQTQVPEAQEPEFHEPPLIPPPPPSPEKRHRSPEHDGYIGQKRLKTDHDGDEHRAVDLSAANWDISAMIQNALGSFDEQLHHPDHLDHSEEHLNHHEEPDHQASHEPISEPAPPSPPLVRKMEHKHMKFSSNPYYVMRTMSLASLGSLAIQILLALSQQSREETLALISDQESEYRTAYDTLKSALDAARRIFSDTNPLLSPDELDISDSEDRETLRVSNLAAISTNAIAGDDSLLVDGHDQFFSIFIPDDGEFSKDLSGLYTNLKTQAMLSSLKNATNPQERSDVLDRFFPPDFDEVLKQRYGDTPFHSGREELVAEIGRKRQELLESILDDEKRQRLSEEYPMNGFLDSLVAYLQNHLAVVIEYAEKYGINIPVSEESVVNEPLENGNMQDDHDELSALLQSATSKLLEELPLGDMGDSAGTGDSLSDSLGLGKLIQESLQNQIGPVKDESAGSSTGDGSGLFESGGLASLIAAKLNNGFDSLANLSQNLANGQGQQQGLGQASNAPMQSPYLAQYNQLSQAPYYSYNNQPPPPPPPPPADGEPLPPNQTLPTSLLYERARQAAVAKSNSAARREGIHSTRRAWTPEEERALMTGLDMVKGPHWSQILSLFGANGTMSDILKDRTQVQLKDKARNLKLFFLKTNSEMPYYLQCVTGELKTRAPGQAARKEAEEKARQNSEEEQARIQGIMTLAGGLQHNHHPANNQQASQVNNHQVNQFSQVSNHQISNGLSNGLSNGQMPMPMQGSPAQARATPLPPTTPTPTSSVGQNGGMATMTPNTNMGPGNPGTPNLGTTAPMTPSMSSVAPLTPRMGGNHGMGLPAPSVAPGSGAPTPTPMSPPVKTEPQDHLTPIQPKPEPHPLQSPQHTEQQGQMPQPQQVQQPQQQPQQPQQPYGHITLPGTQPPAPAHAPEPAQPFTHAATDTNNSGVQPTEVSTQPNYHQDDPIDGLPRLFDYQQQAPLPPHESHNGNNDDVELFGHHDPHDHHDTADIASLLQTLQAATASI